MPRLTEIYACTYETPETRPGACDGGMPCSRPATVIVDGQAWCDRHSPRKPVQSAYEGLDQLRALLVRQYVAQEGSAA